MSGGIFYGVGVGPGDPELITMKALRRIHESDLLSYIANDQGHSQSKEIAAAAMDRLQQTLSFVCSDENACLPFKEKRMIPVIMPMCDNRASANRAYDEASETIMQSLAAGYDVTFLCEGDPLFFGSFAYLLDRIAPHYRCDVVPGISSVHAATAVLQKPLTCLKDSFAVVSGRHSDEKIIETLRQHDSVVIMKAGRARARLLSLLEKAGRRQEAHYLAYIGRAQEQVVIDMDELDQTAEGPYFSLFVVLPQGRDIR